MKGYTNIKADDCCCIGAFLETVLVRYGYKEYTQYDIINKFGLTVPKAAKVSEKIKNITYSVEEVSESP